MEEFSKRYPVTAYLLLAFGVTWVAGLFFIIFVTVVEKSFGIEDSQKTTGLL